METEHRHFPQQRLEQLIHAKKISDGLIDLMLDGTHYLEDDSLGVLPVEWAFQGTQRIVLSLIDDLADMGFDASARFVLMDDIEEID